MLLSATLKPSAAVELGVYMGISSGYIAHGCKKTTVVGVDNNFHPNADVIGKAFPTQIFWITSDTIQAVYTVNKLLHTTKIGLLFVDSTHTTEQATREVLAYKRLLADECVICFDDVLASTMNGFWDSILLEKIRLDFLHAYNYAGFGAAIYRGQNEIFNHNPA
jgi:predicted O-methyltransferase YrrM